MRVKQMKKVVALLLLLSVLCAGAATWKIIPVTSGITTQTEQTRQVHRAIQRLLYPTLAAEIKQQYGPYARIDVYDTEILSMEKASGGDLLLTVRLMPFTGAHNSIAIVDVTLLCTIDSVEILRFEPVKEFGGSSPPEETVL